MICPFAGQSGWHEQATGLFNACRSRMSSALLLGLEEIDLLFFILVQHPFLCTKTTHGKRPDLRVRCGIFA